MTHKPILFSVADDVGLDEWAVDAILERWLERVDSIGARAQRLDGERGIDRAGYVEPSELLWVCTVGSKMERCPALAVHPGELDSPVMPAVEQVVRINAGLAERRNKVETLTRIINRSSAGRGANVTAITPLHRDRARFRREIEWGDGRVRQLVGGSAYRAGRVYLAHSFARCLLDDRSFGVWSEHACWLTNPGALIRAAIEAKRLTVRAVADRLAVSVDTVRHWISGADTRRRVQMPIRYAAALREMLAAA